MFSFARINLKSKLNQGLSNNSVAQNFKPWAGLLSTHHFFDGFPSPYQPTIRAGRDYNELLPGLVTS